MDEQKIKENLLNEYEQWSIKNPFEENSSVYKTLRHLEKFSNYLLSIYKRGYIEGKKEILKKNNDNLN